MPNLKIKFVFILLFPQCLIAQEGVGWGFWPASALGPFSSTALCHSRGTIQVQFLDPGAFFLAGTDPVGAAANRLQQGMTAVPSNSGTIFNITYTYPVENINFTIYDIDGSAGNWQDRIIINPSLAGSSQTANLSCPLGLGACTYTIIGNLADATTTPSTFPNADGQLVINIPGPVDTVSIQYLNHTVPVSTSQFIWLDPVIWSCSIIGVSKQMTRRAGQANGISPYLVDIDFNFENHGDVNLSNLTALEDLDAVFNIPPNVGNYTVTAISLTSGPATFTENNLFNGNSNQELIAAGSSLLPTEAASIRITLAVNNYGSYVNSIDFNGTTPQLAITTDTSTNGVDPDGADNDDNPDESTISTLDTSTLPVRLNYLSTSKANKQLTIQWQSDIEFDHLGYEIYQQDKNGDKIKISKLITSNEKTQSNSLKNYSFQFDTDDNLPIWLVEYSAKGKRTWYGPFTENSLLGQKIINAKRQWPAKSPMQKVLNSTLNELAIEVSQEGMHRIYFSDLINAGLNLNEKSPKDLTIQVNDSLIPLILPVNRIQEVYKAKDDNFAVPIIKSKKRKTIPLYINGNENEFDETTSFDFYAKSIKSLYSDKKIYHLTLKGHSTYIKEDSTKPTGTIDGWYWQTDYYRPNNYYNFTSSTQDPWHADLLATYRIAHKSIEFPIDELADISGAQIQLNLLFNGALDYQDTPTNYPSDPNRCGADHPSLILGIPNDHCIKLNINNEHYGDIVFDGFAHKKAQYILDSEVTNNGTITVSLELLGETGYDHDAVHIEELSLTYPRGLSAIDEVLTFKLADTLQIDSDFMGIFSFEEPKTIDERKRKPKTAIKIEGYSSTDVVAYALNSENPVKITELKFQNDNQGTLSVTIPTISPSQTYWVSSEQKLLKPTFKPWHESQSIEIVGTEYLIISHPDFIETIEQLKAYHESQGLKVLIVNSEDIYAQYSSSIFSPFAIKKFIQEIAKETPIKYILLVGADNYDYKGYLSSQYQSFIPSIYTATDEVVRFTPSDSLFADVDNDHIPDLAIGRFPVNTVQELQLLIDKQMRFINQNNETNTVHFIADTQYNNHSFTDISNQLLEALPDNWSALKSYRDDYPNTETTNNQIMENFANNPKLTTYLGHSGPRNWFSFPSAFTYNDIADLPNSSSPSVVVQWGCWNSYYVEPEANTMAHKFLFDGESGGVAVLGAAALSMVDSEKAFAKLLLPQLTKNNQSIGQAMLVAKRKLSDQANYTDIILGWNLLGDPALKLIQE